MAQVQMALPVEKLNSNNYKLWVFRVKHYLCRGLWEYVQNPPEDPTAAEEVADSHALVAIVLSLSDDQIVHVINANNSAEAWESLRAVYLQQSAGTLISLTTRHCYICGS